MLTTFVVDGVQIENNCDIVNDYSSLEEEPNMNDTIIHETTHFP